MDTVFASVVDFPSNIRALFEQAGWYPGRVAAAYDNPAYPAEIRAVLVELGGLTLPASGVFFTPMHAAQDWQEYADILGRALYPVGQTADNWDVCIDQFGSVYLVFDWLVLMGVSFAEGIINCLLGRGALAPQLNEDDCTWGPDHLVITWPELPAAT